MISFKIGHLYKSYEKKRLFTSAFTAKVRISFTNNWIPDNEYFLVLEIVDAQPKTGFGDQFYVKVLSREKIGWIYSEVFKNEFYKTGNK